MDQRRFVRTRSDDWQRLEALLDGRTAAGAEAVFELGRLYRRATSDLSYAQGRGFDGRLQQYLNTLAGRAHAHVYGRAAGGGGRLGAFLRAGFPGEVRRSWAPIALCAFLTVVAAALAYAIVQQDPVHAYALLPAAMVPPAITRSLHDGNFSFGPQASAAMSSLIITNNVRVAALAFAAGIVTLGSGTIWLIALNGMMLGALASLYGRAGYGADFWVTIAPHGVIELTAIQIAGGAGLLLASAVLFPGRLKRVDAIAAAGRRAGVLIAGVALMLCVAGTIEGFISPLRLPAGARIAVAASTAIAMVLYFSAAGRARRADAA